MFQLNSYLSLILDTVCVVVYFDNPSIVNDSDDILSNSLDPLKSYFLIGILAGLRIIFFLPYIWQFQRDGRLKYPSIPYIWHLSNTVIIAIKAIDNFVDDNQDSYQWFFLLFSTASILFQCIGLNHLKSTAIPEREVVLGMSRSNMEDEIHNNDAQVALLNSSGANSSGQRKYSNDIILSMKKRFDIAQETWKKGIAKFNQQVGIFNQDEYGPVFKHVVDLFRGEYEGSDPIVELKSLFENHAHEIEFYIPEITIFLLYGSFGNSESLQDFLFYLCQKSPTIAHKIRWFVVSFCLSGAGVGKTGINALNVFVSQIEKQGALSSSRALLMSCGQEPSSLLYSKPGESFNVIDTVNREISVDRTSTVHTIQLSAKSGESIRSVNDQQASSSQYPFKATVEFRKHPVGEIASIDGFTPTVTFWDDLVQISRELCSLPRDNRTSEMRKKLSEWKSQFLPSATIYSPVGAPQHRIWDIHAEESFAFSTRERAPILVCLEVVDFDFHLRKKQEESKPWWAIDIVEIKKSINKVIDIFDGEKSNEETAHGDDAIDTPVDNDQLHTSIYSISDRSFQSSGSGIRPNLGERVESTNDIISIENARVVTEEKHTDSYFRRDEVEEKLKWNQVQDIESFGNRGQINDCQSESQEANRGGNRARNFSFPIQKEGDDDEIGQWARPSIPRRISEKKSSLDAINRNTQSGSFQGLSRWISEAGNALGRRKDDVAAEMLAEAPSDQLGVYSVDAEYGYFRHNSSKHSDVDVNISSDSLYIPDPGNSSENESNIERSNTFRSLKNERIAKRTVSADPKLGSSNSKESSSREKLVSYDDGADSNPLGHFKADRDGSSDGVQSNISSNAEYASQPPLVVFKEPWTAKELRIRKRSSVGHLLGWKLLPVIVKSGDDLRQEQIVSHLLFQIYYILKTAKVGTWIRPYGIIAISPDSGIIEAIPDTVSLDVLRRRVPQYTTLIDFYERFYGDRESPVFLAARENFLKSLAGYSIVCYLLQLKDRHNGNILIDNRGHIIHIDFGFVLGITPGRNMGFEKAPFKLTNEMIELLDGAHSSTFHRYRDLCVKTFMSLRKEHHRIVLLLEMLSKGSGHLPCFGGAPHKTLEGLKDRFCTDLNDNAAIERVHRLIDSAANNWTTTCYDRYQRCFTGVF